MMSFDYFDPRTLDQATGLLRAAGGKASLLAGGTDLLVQMKEHARRPEQVIDLKKIPGLDDFAYDAKRGLVLGALVTTRQVETSPVTLRHYAGLAKASTDFASIQVRHRATVVGNVCRASPSADTLPPLIADGAVLRIHGSAGQRRCAVQDFCTGPGRTTLAPDEIVTHIEIPPPPPRTGKAYIKHGRRAQMELATVGVAVRLTLADDGRVADLGIVLAAVAPTPLHAIQAEAALRGQRPTADRLAAAAQAASAEARPIGDVRGSADYRREMVRVLTRRALEQAIQQATHDAEARA
ncbi:MAG: xanthine dehydrogenase family protein subunit M [Ideonella sp.]|nr:xanthine dehydrogenase family protein subunit M [Ideonella sp.]MCC7457073.1 xanthine dehydrogenase family protein subunit M [Nitrospira sp.]